VDAGSRSDQGEVRPHRRRVWLVGEGAPRSGRIAAVTLEAARVGRYGPGARTRGQYRGLQRDQVLPAPLIALGPVEMIVSRLVRDQVADIRSPAPELEGIVQTGHHLDVLVGRAATDGVAGQPVQLLPALRHVISGEFDPDVLHGTAVVGGIGTACVVLRGAGR